MYYGKLTYANQGIFVSLARVRAPLGVSFSAMRKTRKNRQRRGLPPPCGIHPAVLVGVCVLLCSALGLVESHRWLALLWFAPTPLLVHSSASRALPWQSSCSQLPIAWLPAAATPLLQDRPGRENHPAIGPAAMVAWCSGRNRSHSKGNGPNIALTHSQSRTPGGSLGGERPKRVLVPFARSKGTPSGQRPRQAGKPAPEKLEQFNSSVSPAADSSLCTREHLKTKTTQKEFSLCALML